MATPSVCLVSVAAGEVYVRYARRMFASAADFFRPTDGTIALRPLPGREGPWPAGTIYRYHVICEHAHELEFDYIFMCDADMRFEAHVGSEILGAGITATQHPGYVGMPVESLPYERRPESSAVVGHGSGERYYAGGFIGGTRDAFLRLARTIAMGVEADAAAGIVAQWHDESQLNRYLVSNPPAVALSPAYCHPENDDWYRSAIWPEDYPRLLVALDKSADEREGR